MVTVRGVTAIHEYIMVPAVTMEVNVESNLVKGRGEEGRRKRRTRREGEEEEEEGNEKGDNKELRMKPHVNIST